MKSTLICLRQSALPRHTIGYSDGHRWRLTLPHLLLSGEVTKILSIPEIQTFLKLIQNSSTSLPSHTLIHLISNSYQQPTYWAPPSFYPNLETYAPTYFRTLSHDGIIIMPGYHRVGFPGKSYYGTAQNQKIMYQHKTTIFNTNKTTEYRGLRTPE